MITQVGPRQIPWVVDILNESYRGAIGWTTEYGLVAGQRATPELIRHEIDAGYQYYLFEYEDGYAGCFNLSRKDDSVEIGGFAIKVGLQSRGLGRSLLSAAEALALSQPGVARLIVSVLEPREELIRFYERCGYQRTAVRYPFPSHRGVGEPLVENLHLVVLEKPILTFENRAGENPWPKK